MKKMKNEKEDERKELRLDFISLNVLKTQQYVAVFSGFLGSLLFMINCVIINLFPHSTINFIISIFSLFLSFILLFLSLRVLDNIERINKILKKVISKIKTYEQWK